MKRILILTALLLVGRLIVTKAAEAFQPRRMPIKPDRAVIARGFDSRHIEVKFLDETDIGLSDDGIPHDRADRQLKSPQAQEVMHMIADGGGTWKRMSGIEERELDRLVANAESNLDRDIADINNYFILTVPDEIKTEDWIDELNSLPDVEIALAMPLAMPLPAIPGNYQGLQGYLNNATDGIGAATAWGQPGGTGWPSTGPIKVCDFEYSWNLNHQDLPFVNYDYNPLYTPSDPFSDDNHGTAVIGEIASLNNGWGTTGAVYAVQMWVSPTYLDSAWQLGVAMLWELTALGPGDVFLIEHQFAGPNYTGVPPGTQDGLVPVEWWESWYNIIVTAVGNGIHVVEAAGNGREDLDDIAYDTGNGGHWPFLPQNNSGAIIVGAGAAPPGFGGSDTDRSRLWFSNWGSRLDLQGWGEQVVTIGYGDYYAAEGKNLWYTNTFAGTSSASPIVASAVAILEGIHQESTGNPVPPSTMRSVLKSTGSPQQSGTYPTSQNIGPRPDVAAALAVLLCCNHDGIRGDVDYDLGGPNIADLTYLVDFLFRGGPSPPCTDEADVDGDGSGPNVADLTYLVDFLFRAGPAPPACP